MTARANNTQASKQTIEDLMRIKTALESAVEILKDYTPGDIAARDKGGGDPVTEADERVDAALKKALLRTGEGWLSEETADSPERLNMSRVWVVDPLDGTREFVAGIPEWSVSVGLVVDGKPTAGGIVNPQTGEFVLGSIETGITYNGEPAGPSPIRSLDGAEVLASRSEVKRGEWEQYADQPFTVRPTGSVAYKLALVAAGKTGATWTLSPKNEWDIAAGVALVQAGGGFVTELDGSEPVFNQKDPLRSGLIAGPQGVRAEIESLLKPIIAGL
ncbi:3'(2'),5'-bisphosphate nucleotidase CysQ [candidate division GN15 bacterium]|nr:3'(2'),5'-bisphosphate nucleotidase CysQ [candidate division GN15 bacterium]